MVKMAEQIMDGDVQAKPFADAKGSACDFCAYADVCGFDRKIPGMSQKRVPEIDKCKVWEQIAQESGIGEEDTAAETSD